MANKYYSKIACCKFLDSERVEVDGALVAAIITGSAEYFVFRCVCKRRAGCFSMREISSAKLTVV